MITTLHNLFFPQRIKNFYLFTSSELSIYIREHTIEASLFVLHKEVKTLKAVWNFPYTKHEELLQHIQALYKATSASTTIEIILDSSSLFFKKIDLPFKDYEKIKAVLPFELESFLPVPLSETCFDFIITHQTESSSSILVVVIPKKTLTEKLKPFEELQIPIDCVSVDTVELYRIASKEALKYPQGCSVFIAIEENSTKILLFDSSVFLNLRIINKQLESESSLVDEIMFTIKTYYSEQSLPGQTLSIVLFGDISSTFKDLVNKQLNNECTLFIGNTFLEEQGIINDTNSRCTLISYACIPTHSEQNEFNINNETISTKQFLLFQKNLITISFLSLSILGLLTFHIFSQINFLKKRLINDQTKIMAVMKKTFPSVEEEVSKINKKPGAQKKNIPLLRQISQALTLANKDISQETSILSAFSAQNRNSFLEYLVILSTKIDRETLGLELKKMTINKATITLEGRVRNFEALEQFEKALKETELFFTIPDMQKIDFTISLPLVSKGGLS